MGKKWNGAKLEHALNAEVVNHATGAVGFDTGKETFISTRCGENSLRQASQRNVIQINHLVLRLVRLREHSPRRLSRISDTLQKDRK